MNVVSRRTGTTFAVVIDELYSAQKEISFYEAQVLRAHFFFMLMTCYSIKCHCFRACIAGVSLKS